MIKSFKKCGKYDKNKYNLPSRFGDNHFSFVIMELVP